MSEGSLSNTCIFPRRHITVFMYLGTLVSTSALFRGHLNQKNYQQVYPNAENGGTK